MKNIIFALIALLVVAAGVYYFVTDSRAPEPVVEMSETTPPPTETDTPTVATSTPATPSETTTAEQEPTVTIGTSVEGRPIKAYHFGDGEREVLLIGGIHGGYSWNTALLGYELIKWFSADESLIPDDVTVTIIPTLNPDGLQKITGTAEEFTARDVKGTEQAKVAARFNANQVDLNRNFTCGWKSEGTWQNRRVSGGTAPFSEPETQALRDYVNEHEPTAVIAWYSAAGGVYASRCEEEILPGTRTLMNTFAQAAGYRAYDEYDYYEITGDMVNWFAQNEIPAVSVLLTTHDATELAKNQAGLRAALQLLSRTAE